MPGRPPDVTDFEILCAVQRALSDGSGPVVTTREVADELPIKREGVGKRLNDLLTDGLLRRKKVGASHVWWLPRETAAILPSEISDRASVGPSPPATEADRRADAIVQRLLDLGTERFDMEQGVIARVDPDTDHFEIEYTSNDRTDFDPGIELPLSETYCTEPTRNDGPAGVFAPEENGFDDRTVYEEFGLRAYLGTLVEIDDDVNHTFFFISTERREESFTEADYAIHELLAERLEHELDRNARSSVRRRN